MAYERDQNQGPEDDRALKISVAVLSIGIVLVMGAIHTFMTYQGANVLATKRDAPRPQTSSVADGRVCTVSTRPSGATVFAIRGESREALGVTPVEIDQGPYAIRIELTHFAPLEAEVGDRGVPCLIHRELTPAAAP